MRMTKESPLVTPIEVATAPEPIGLRPARLRLLRAILLSAVIVIIGLMTIGAEYGARYYERHRDTAPDYFPSIFYPHRRLRYGLVPGLDYYGWFRINSLGFRGREFSTGKAPGAVRIVCLGASTTFDTGSIGANPPWPEVMETELRRHVNDDNIEVLNLGIPGATSLDSLIDLQMRALAFQPDLLVVYQAHNDFIYSIPSPAGTAPSDLFPLEDRPRGRVERWLTLHSLLYAKTEGRVTDSINRLIDLLPLPAEHKGPVQDRTRAIDEGVATFRANLKAIAAIAGLNGVPLALPGVIVPFPSTVPTGKHCQLCEGLSGAYGNVPLDQVRATFDRYNKVLEELGTQPAVHYIATNEFVPSLDAYYHDPVHFSPAGSVRMGERLAAAVLPIVQELTRGKSVIQSE